MADAVTAICMRQAKELVKQLQEATALLGKDARDPCEAFFAEVIAKSPPGVLLATKARDEEDRHLRFVLLLDWARLSDEEDDQLEDDLTGAHVAVKRANKRVAFSSFRIEHLARGTRRDAPNFGEAWLRKNDRDYDLILETELFEARGGE